METRNGGCDPAVMLGPQPGRACGKGLAAPLSTLTRWVSGKGEACRAQDRIRSVSVLAFGRMRHPKSNIWHRVTGGLIGGPVGAVVGGSSGAILARPGGVLGGASYRYRCHYHDRYGHVHYHCR
jgi:hypothetical protein